MNVHSKTERHYAIEQTAPKKLGYNARKKAKRQQYAQVLLAQLNQDGGEKRVKDGMERMMFRGFDWIPGTETRVRNFDFGREIQRLAHKKTINDSRALFSLQKQVVGV